ncbi:MAG: glycerol kinase [Acidobacteria bacterium RIFCSPLOWO2_12_FULL_67_14b]|nr:MAG: glycerol kinase [Acidobacteria bacterium RIFCSPLOWO2_12_FULL_67_14b]
MSRFVLALDQGTTSSRAIVFDRSGKAVSAAQQEFPQIFPGPGHVEHDPEAIWATQLQTAKDAMARAGITAADLAAIGVTNQRETTVLWEKASGKPIANAIVWQSRVTASICDRLKAAGLEPTFRRKTGLVVDAYFSGTKIKHLLDSHDGMRARAARGEILFGTIDTFLIWRLTGGRCHVTDVSNASRTLLFNIHTLQWDDELLTLLDVPRAMLPEVRSSSEVYGHTDPALLGGAVPVAGDAGDQQAALFGQACFEPGSAKNTYGTGCFMLLNTGDKPVPSEKGLLTTVAWKIGGTTTYALEGSVFVAGAAVQWLRDGLKAIAASADVERLTSEVKDTDGVYLVPAFVGLGAPYWDPRARGAIVGLTRNTTIAHIARAAVEAMAYQTRDVLEIMQVESKLPLTTLKVDGGAAANAMLLQFQADLLNVTVRRPVVAETTALGAAYLAGLAVGYWKGLDDVAGNWALDREFRPAMEPAARERLYAGWKKAVGRSLDWES